MFLMIDNYDSFVYNLIAYIQELGREIKVIRNDDIDFEALEKLLHKGSLEGIIISPGPKSPTDCGASGEIIKKFQGRVPILGVCLGHQIIAHQYGGIVEKGLRPMHGKVTTITNNGEGLFKNLPTNYDVTRYHSLVVNSENLPDCLNIDAWTNDGVIMAISHKLHPIYGVQFHPEAVLTKNGYLLLENFLSLCENEWRQNENAS